MDATRTHLLLAFVVLSFHGTLGLCLRLHLRLLQLLRLTTSTASRMSM